MSNSRKFRGSERRGLRITVEIAVGIAGAAILVCVLRTGSEWQERHFLPSFFTPHHMFVLAATSMRIAAAGIGTALIFFLRPRIGRLAARVPARRFLVDAASILLAIVLALGTSELVLRRTYRRAAEEMAPTFAPFRHADPFLGWTFVPSRTGSEKIGGRVVDYTFDSAGYRVQHAGQQVNPDLPTIVFTGESIVVGEGLTWEESLPAQVEGLLGTQCANIAVNGFATDQAYLRLKAELPRFRKPLAVVSLFMPTLFDRNLDEDRPHLGPGLAWLPANPPWRLVAVARLAVPYRIEEAIEREIGITREVLLATVNLARERGAVPIILVPQFAPAEPGETVLIRRILDEASLPYLLVELDPDWRVPGDRHPDARADHAMAVAIAARLQGH